MKKETRYIITKRVQGSLTYYLRHEGHTHIWGRDRDEAMEYTKREVAQALADKNGGHVIEQLNT